MDLPAFLEDRREAMLEHAEGAVHRAHLDHYEAGGSPLIRERLGRLLGLVIQCARRHDAGPMVAHATRVAHERYAAGYQLHEVQTAFNVVEEALWKEVLDRVPLEEQGKALGLISTLLGAGKDALAREYVAEANRGRRPSFDTETLIRGF